MGKTYEGRDIPALILTNSGSGQKKTIFFECGIHAREWISVAVCLYMTNKLLTDPKNNELLDKYEFIIVPTLNADGYADIEANGREEQPLTHSVADMPTLGSTTEAGE